MTDLVTVLLNARPLLLAAGAGGAALVAVYVYRSWIWRSR